MEKAVIWGDIMKKSKKILCAVIGALLLIVLGIWIFSKVSGHLTKPEEKEGIAKLRVCHLENPLGLDESTPIFSWQMRSTERGSYQTSYRLVVARGEEELKDGEYCWDSGEVFRAESVGISYEGEELEAKTRYFWQVQVTDQKGEKHDSEIAWFETGLLGEGMEEAKWISAGEEACEPAFTDTVYDIAYTLEVDDAAASFVFGACEGRYGKMYLCEIENREEAAFFRIRQMNNNMRTLVGEVDITACRNAEKNGVFEVEISVQGNRLTADINGTPVANEGLEEVFAIEETQLGSIGYFIDRGISYAWLDDIRVKNEAGVMLYEEDFEDAENIFTPYYVHTQDGRLRMGSGLMLTYGAQDPAPIFRKEFILQDKEIKSARAYMTALGCFELTVNGQAVSQDYFAPGKPAYNKQLTYVTYDVTEYLKRGEANALGIILLHGWYDRAVGHVDNWNPWGNTNALLGMIEIVYEDGSSEKLITDESFSYTLEGPVREDDIYQGEYYDADYEKTGFDLPGYETDASWKPAEENRIREEYFLIPLYGKMNEPVSQIQTLAPVSVTEPQENVFVYDFGQNFAGICRIKVKGEKGQVITLRYGEAVNEENLINKDDATGTVWTENLLTAEATDYYVLKGEEEGEVFEPKYVFHGFRYLQITGIEEALPVSDVEGIVLSSDLEQTGEFVSSDESLNRYYQNTLWSQKSNFIDNPMDCPQRDERHGWAGDAQIFSLTGSYHMDTYAFYRKYLMDMRSIQNDGGSFPDMAPRNFGTQWDGTGGAASNNCWGDAPVVISWNLYTQFGDRQILEENYDALCRWVNMLVETSDNYIRYWGGYGDHLSEQSTPMDVTDTAWCAKSAELLSRMADILGKTEDAAYYRQIYENYKKAWQEHYVTAEGLTTCDTQTSYVLGLAFGLFPEELEEAAKERLVLLAEYSGYKIATGYAGVASILPVLSDAGLEDVAYKLLLQKEYPSLLYLAEHGATTTWESFFSYQANGEQYRLDGSLNHYAFGSVAGFVYTDILGIQSDETDPGYHHILLEPKTDEALSYAKGSYESMYGRIESAWEKTESGYRYTFVIPANTSATLTLPAPEEGKLYKESGKKIDEAEGVEILNAPEGKVCYKLLAGSYSFITEAE